LKSDRQGHVIVLNGMENDEVPDVADGVITTLLSQQSPAM
jgi:hypothetical protein